MQDRNEFDHSGGRYLSSREARPWINQLNRFLYSPQYMVLVAALTLISNVFGGEMIAYSIIIAIGIYTILFCRDFLPTMPLFVCGYITPSVANNPGSSSSSIFYPANGGLLLAGLLVLVLLTLLIRLSFDSALRTKLFTTKRILWPGLLFLGISYLLSGIGSLYYGQVYGRNLLFALLQFASFACLYWFFCGAVYWEIAPRNYFAWLGTMVGIVLLLELGNIYLSNDLFVNGKIKRDYIFTGWGNYNNIGALLAAMLPFPYYFASQSRKHSWIYHILGLLIFAGVIFSNSRGAILFAGMIYTACIFLVLWKCKNRIQNCIAYVVAITLAVGIIFCLGDRITQVFAEIIHMQFAPSGRDQIYIDGIRQFLRNPIFGGSFFPETEQPSWAVNQGFIYFFPPRWHNTLIQIAASCGLLGLVAYGIHRAQTVALFCNKKNRTMRKAFVGLSVLVLLGTSLLDCHLFNVGPAFYYSVALAFAEHGVDEEP